MIIDYWAVDILSGRQSFYCFDVNVITIVCLQRTEINEAGAAMAAAENRKVGGCFPSIGSIFKRSQKRVGMMERCLSFKAPKKEVNLRNSFERNLDVDEKISEWHLPDEWNTDFQNEQIKKDTEVKKTAVKDFFALKPTMVLSTRPSKSPPLSAKNDDSCSLTNIPQLNSRSSFSSTPYQCLNSIVGLSRTFSTMSYISRNMSGKDENRPSNDIEDDDNAILYTCQSFNEIVANPRKMSNKSDKIKKGSYRDATQDNEIVFEGCLLLKPKSDSASPRKFSLKSPFTTVSRNNLTDEFSSLTVLEIVREDEATTPGSSNSIGGFSSQNSSKDRHVALLESLSGKSYHSNEER